MSGKPGMRRPPRLTPDRESRLVDSIRAGNTMAAAAETAGLGERTVFRYMARGETADRALNQHLNTLTPTRRAVLDRWNDEQTARYLTRHIPGPERIYWQLWQAVMRARAESEERAVAIIREVGLGYEAPETVVEERDVLAKDGTVITLRTRRTITRHVRDWRAEAWWLERQRRDEFGRAERVEVTGAEGGPVQVEHLDIEAVRVRARESIEAWRLRRLEIEAPAIDEAEVVQ